MSVIVHIHTFGHVPSLLFLPNFFLQFFLLSKGIKGNNRLDELRCFSLRHCIRRWNWNCCSPVGLWKFLDKCIHVSVFLFSMWKMYYFSLKFLIQKSWDNQGWLIVYHHPDGEVVDCVVQIMTLHMVLKIQRLFCPSLYIYFLHYWYLRRVNSNTRHQVHECEFERLISGAWITDHILIQHFHLCHQPNTGIRLLSGL